jgi:predicted dehydrogenase
LSRATGGGTMLEMATHRIEVLLNFAGPARPSLVSVGADVKVILTPPGVFCVESH